MTSDHPDRHEAGFRGHVSLSAARELLREHVSPVERTETLSLSAADGRVLAEAVASRRDVPHYRRAAMDGYAVRAGDVGDAAERSPALLDVHEPAEPANAELAADAAVRVHTGSAVPDAADAVVPVEHVERVGDRIELTEPVAPGEHVAPVGEDVEDGQALYDPGHRLRPSDLGLLKVAGIDEVTVRERPTVGVVPTGEELVQRDPGPGEAVETNGLTVSRLVERWGGQAEYRPIVTDERHALRASIQRDLPKDLVVTTGGSSVGERDLVPDVVDDLGEVLVHGVAIQPGHPVAIGVVEGTPVLCLPGYPVSCIVTAVQLLWPALRWRAGLPAPSPPTREARLARKVDSEPGKRTFARVSLRGAAAGDPAVADDDAGDTGSLDGETGGLDGDAGGLDDAASGVPGAAGVAGDEASDGPTLVAEPTRARGAGVLSSVGLADGWVVVPEDSEGIAADERVAVEDWEWSP